MILEWAWSEGQVLGLMTVLLNVFYSFRASQHLELERHSSLERGHAFQAGPATLGKDRPIEASVSPYVAGITKHPGVRNPGVVTSPKLRRLLEEVHGKLTWPAPISTTCIGLCSPKVGSNWDMNVVIRFTS